jgi:hypothetical protein
MPDHCTLKMLRDLLAEVRESRTENQRLHAHTDVMIVEAVSKHDADPHAHRSLFAELERRLKRLEGKRDDEPRE